MEFTGDSISIIKRNNSYILANSKYLFKSWGEGANKLNSLIMQ